MVTGKESGKKMVNALTFDIEEWYQTVFFLNKLKCGTIKSILRENVTEVLSFLDYYKKKATFFVVGAVAEKYPDLIEAISRGGHEVASHGYLHRLVYKFTREEFYDDVAKSLEVLNRITGKKVLGYRAPTWSITRACPWALDVLGELGLQYDSSIYSIGASVPVSAKSPYKIRGRLLEFPPSTVCMSGVSFPFAGGLFLRFLPDGFIKNSIASINKQGRPAIVYFHSWEFDATVSSQGLSKLKYTVQFWNIDSVKRKLCLLLENFKFSPICSILGL